MNRQWEEGIWKEVQLENKLNEKLMAKGAAAPAKEVKVIIIIITK